MLALEDLIARLEREAGTSGTSRDSADVPAKAAQTLGGTSGTSRNDKAEHVSAAVAFQAPPGSTVARIAAAGGTSRIGGPRPGGGLYKTAAMPGDCPAELVDELEREGWHVLRIIEAGRRAEPRPDLDPAE